MFGRAVDGVPATSILTSTDDEYVARSLVVSNDITACGLDQERTDMVDAGHGDPACRTSWWTLNSSMHGSDRPGGSEQQIASPLASVANAEETGQRQISRARLRCPYSMYWDQAPDR